MTIRERYKTHRGLKEKYSPFIRGHQFYYNYIIPHERLFGKTPTRYAGINLELGNCKWQSLLLYSLNK